MNTELREVLTKIGEEFEEEISDDSKMYLEVDIGKEAEKLGYSDLKEKYRGMEAVVPLKHTIDGMKVMIDGRTFVDYAQLETGVVIPGHIAREASLPSKHYEAPESIVRVFSET
jgi:hypothetical protein